VHSISQINAGHRVYLNIGRKEEIFMKKVLKLILLVAMIAALSVCAFAASPEVTQIEDQSGAAELTEITAEIPEGITVEVVAPTQAAANESAAKAADPEAVVLDSFDVNVTDDATGEKLHSGVTVTITLIIPEEYIGYTLKLYEDGVLVKSVEVTGTTVTLELNSFSTYTPVLVKPAAGGETTPTTPQTSPQTMQSILPFALAAIAVLALAGAVYARKRSFN